MTQYNHKAFPPDLLLIELAATRNGIITGKGTEDNQQFTIFGMVDARVGKFFFVRIKGNDVTYCNGDAQLQGEIFFQGKWQVGTHRGGFTLIKYIQDSTTPEADAAVGNHRMLCNRTDLKI
jgi:hypothetical protein